MHYTKPYASHTALRANIRQQYLADETRTVETLLNAFTSSVNDDLEIQKTAVELIQAMRQNEQTSGLMDQFLQEFSLSSQEGIILMCLAEALLRIPDAQTADALISDKLGSGDWQAHLGNSDSLLVNASTWGMLLTGKWLTLADGVKRSPYTAFKKMLTKSGTPSIRLALRQAMKIMGHQFVLAENIKTAVKKSKPRRDKGFNHSYDMLGEAAKTQADAKEYFNAYLNAITELARQAKTDQPDLNHGISVKLSALHPRYEFAKAAQVEAVLYPRLLLLAQAAYDAQLGFNIDAEEADKLEISLSLFQKLAEDPSLKNWEGLGFVVQAYQKRAMAVIEWLADLAQKEQRRFMLRLVKGAYWDTEIKQAQVQGYTDYPVFTRKPNTDLSYLVCAKTLLTNTDAFYPQFATHNAHTVASIIAYAEQASIAKDSQFEFQCLYGMGESLYTQLVGQGEYRCRIYAPVGEHKQLLAYLVRRLLENGANTSFVHLLADKQLDVESIVANPLDSIRGRTSHRHAAIALPQNLLGSHRQNTLGLNLADSDCLDIYYADLKKWQSHQWCAAPILASNEVSNTAETVSIPAGASHLIGTVQTANAPQIDAALTSAQGFSADWNATGGASRAELLEAVAALYEQHRNELMALCQLEAGKTLVDAVSEYREAVDFLRYYAQQARQLFVAPEQLMGPTGEKNQYQLHGRGVFVCISPWNFPLAIFTGQIAAALVAGNTVLAKPAEQAPLIAWRAVQLFHEAGVPLEALQLLIGGGAEVGGKLTSDRRVHGVVFTGGMDTARLIHQSLADRPNSPLPHLIAETGGLNAMIVDSSALPEQVVQDVVASAFQSAGQRCSALRVLYLQDDIADEIIKMITGAMAELETAEPTLLDTDIGPIIDTAARAALQTHLDEFKSG
ncbi:MAG: bifunctional proline dehydrogenase/L-glutamate gamma-semialdehyde dehydrogenase PutA, partial [Arenicellales bacterium]